MCAPRVRSATCRSPASRKKGNRTGACALRLFEAVTRRMTRMADALSWFKSTDWLANHLGDPNLVVVDGSFYLPAQNRNARAEYLEKHIPGSVFFDIDAVADHSTDLPHMLP